MVGNQLMKELKQKDHQQSDYPKISLSIDTLLTINWLLSFRILFSDFSGPSIISYYVSVICYM